MALTHSMKIRFGSSVEIDYVPHRLGGADSNIKSINNRLAEIFLHSGASQAT